MNKQKEKTELITIIFHGKPRAQHDFVLRYNSKLSYKIGDLMESGIIDDEMRQHIWEQNQEGIIVDIEESHCFYVYEGQQDIITSIFVRLYDK